MGKKKLKPPTKKRTAKSVEIDSRLDALEEMICGLEYEVKNLKARASRTDVSVENVALNVGAVSKSVKKAASRKTYEDFIGSF